MDFELTAGQKQALDMAEKLMDDDMPCSRGVITGFAGTGKTTMIKAIASRFGAPTILTPTGKAAVRVQEATGLTAGTLHRWMYQVREDEQSGDVKWELKPYGLIDRPYNGLIVVDEASMVTRKIWEDLWNLCQLLDMKVILVGDTFQLPPVEMRPENADDKSFSSLVDVETPFRAHLTEVTRQALDNPILRASMLLRESSRIEKALQLLNRVFAKNFDAACMETYKAGGAIIVHKNDTRHRINRMIRDQLGYGMELREGEPLLVLRNNYSIDRFNGEIIPYEGWLQYDNTMKAVADRWRNISLMLTFGVAKVDGSKQVMLVPEQVRGDAQAMSESVIAKNSKRYYGDWYHSDEAGPLFSDDGQYLGPSHLHANFGYALTAHKSQGSEWDQALVLVERSTRPTTIEGRRWLYTAITRAKQNCAFCTEV